MSELTVTIDGEEHTVSKEQVSTPDGVQMLSNDEIDEQYVSKDFHEERVNDLRSDKEKEINRVSERFRDARLDELLEDEEVQDRLQKKFGRDPEDMEVVQDLRSERDELHEEKEQLQEQLSQYEQKLRRQEIGRIAEEYGIAKRFRRGLHGDGPVSDLSQLPGRLEERDGDLVVTDKDGNPKPAPAGSDRSFMTLEDQIQQWEDSEDHDYLFEGQEPTSGSGFEGGGSPSSDGYPKDASLSQKAEHLKNQT